ncbi:prepilin-type N-terminal cleavage/methylation domain-containing protein [Neobacillus sp. CF12]|uniref:prepilin-type N-terminal cleavage/methylation domain-containing protein n=1 Tax=Neobacillus sp. CF12 TaxID=3055864 RepID=UPI0025A1D1B2|nr:prepilin-type N-terminal cleavage/methylation domain-containing protein [Neobacillus sp. CF12]MDM5330836.1 prepilin-type N-terminal cleavage/methylation domain-containing protein [Neobacillus sp. CF12]
MLKKLGSKLKEQKGFTLIELLAVIVILGIIAAIAIPAIGNVISKSENKAEVQEGLQIINAAKMYVANNPDTTNIELDYATAKTTGKDNLKEFLDRVEDKGFKVTVKHNTTSGKYTYYLDNHAANTHVPGADAAGATEQELIEFTN